MIDPIGFWHQATKPALGAQSLDIANHLARASTDDVLISA